VRSHATAGREDLVAARLASHAREAVGEHAAPQERSELALDVPRQPAAVRIRSDVRRRYPAPGCAAAPDVPS
jgi:hypothetical protein